ncbi:hypothetical protein Sinac_6042 [Singulisphaera acidiphila DSM 18658]|uniref:Uncharacterized protein n=2 Tax=Singulisphaera acidiphila TaxID=466153 RepID=L0DLM8_SINAD|nr:hypothetical protein Sinac_6042 [Singulisphaera acidiphila DSM 18658]
MCDGEFLMRCKIPDEPLKAQVALAARRAIAQLGTVPTETIRPDDRFAHDLVQLPFWDSLDWLGYIIEVEQPFEGKVVFDSSVIDEAVKLAGGRPLELRVKHVVRATVLAASYRPEKAVLYEDI